MSDQPSDLRPVTRDRIVEAARQLFFQQGYSATGIAQIVAAAETRSGSLYHFFPSKEDLLIAVLERYRGMLEPQVLRPAFERVSDPLERVFAVLDGYRRLLEATKFDLGCPIGNLVLEASNSHPAVRPLLMQNFEGWLDAIETLIRDMGGRLPSDIEPRTLARHVLATMEGAVMLARAYRDIEPFDGAVHQLRDYFERLLRDGTHWGRESVLADRPEAI